MTGWTLLWLVWLLAFCLIEGVALSNCQAGDTLSEQIWCWASIKNKGAWWRFRRFLLVALLAWLCLHFLSGGSF